MSQLFPLFPLLYCMTGFTSIQTAGSGPNAGKAWVRKWERVCGSGREVALSWMPQTNQTLRWELLRHVTLRKYMPPPMGGMNNGLFLIVEDHPGQCVVFGMALTEAVLLAVWPGGFAESTGPLKTVSWEKIARGTQQQWWVHGYRIVMWIQVSVVILYRERTADLDSGYTFLYVVYGSLWRVCAIPNLSHLALYTELTAQIHGDVCR